MRQHTERPALTWEALKSSDGASLRFAHNVASAARRPDGRPRVLLLHSFASDHTIWDGVAALLAPQTEMVVVDLRGHGSSDLGDPAHLTLGHLADDVVTVLDHVGWDAAVLVGCSMGGCVALRCAADHPRRVSGLTLVSTTAWYGSGGADFWSSVAARGRAEGPAALAPELVARWFSDDYRTTHPETVDRVANTFATTDPRTFEGSCRMLGEMDLRPAAPGIAAPTAVVVGSEDLATPPSMAAELAGLLVDATLDELPGVRHLLPLELPAEVAEIIVGVARRAP